MLILFSLPSVLALAILGELLLAPAVSYAGPTDDRPNHHRKLAKATSCTLLVAVELRIDPEDGVADEWFECEMDPIDVGGISSISLPIQSANAAQELKLKQLLKDGKIESGKSTLKFGNSVISFDKDGIYLPNSLAIAIGKKEEAGRPIDGRGNANIFKNQGNLRRNLVVTTGVKPVLVVRVTSAAPENLVVDEIPEVIGDDIFGTIDDPVNLASQMKACSFSQLDIVPGPIADPTIQAAPGVIEVSIGVTLEGSTKQEVRNAVTTAVQNKLGILSLPGPYQQVMYVLHSCKVDCGWAAYAYINSWNSVYQGGYYKMTGVLMHELGHNFGLAHSGGLDGETYTDHTGLMGNPLYSDDVGKMCWNAAKTWQIGWYDSHKAIVNPREQAATSLTLVGIADFENNPENNPVVIKIETGTTTDTFIAFNRAIGVNAENDEADDEVTIVETGANGEAYSQSSLKATLVQGESYTFPNWQGTSQNLTVHAITIDLTVDPGVATVQICLGPCPGSCETNADCDDELYCNGAEICNAGVCVLGAAPVCDDGMFCNGLETCDENGNDGAGGCIDGSPPQCTDDGNPCNGVEQCSDDAGACVAVDPIDCSGEFSFCGMQKECNSTSAKCEDVGSGEDGTCQVESGETCGSCPDDCSIAYAEPVCGNGICEAGESCGNCPTDCNGRTDGNPNRRYCCSGGPGGTCLDDRCNASGNTCNANSAPTGSGRSCCGDAICEGNESVVNCPADCVAPPPPCETCRWTGQVCCGSCSKKQGCV